MSEQKTDTRSVHKSGVLYVGGETPPPPKAGVLGWVTHVPCIACLDRG